MSTYGTAFVIDVATDVDAEVVAAAARSLDGECRVRPLDGYGHRFSGYVKDIEMRSEVEDLLGGLDVARAVVAEDFDEFGAAWTVLACRGGTVETLHRHYILHADPMDSGAIADAIDDLGEDPRTEDIAGPAAAEAAATLFDVPPDAMITAERESASAWQSLDTVGGPFPWLTALGLVWPGDDESGASLS